MTTPGELDEPVENPELCAALQEFARQRDARTEQELTRQLRSAVFLVPVLVDELQVASAETEEPVAEQGSRVQIVSCVDAAGAQHLALFTDGAAMRAWTDRPVSTLALPAAQAWDTVLARDEYAGAVVNPGTGQPTLPLAKETIARLRGGTEPEGAAEVAQALERLAQDPTESNRVDLYIALQRSTLLLGALGVPKEGPEAAARAADENTPIQMLTASTQEGGTVLLAFTSMDELHQRSPGMSCFGMRALDILRLVVGGSYTGLVVNPGSNGAFVPKLDAEVVVSDAAAREEA